MCPTSCHNQTDWGLLVLSTVVKNLLKDVKDGLIEDGTAIGMGLATAVSRLKESKKSVKIFKEDLLSDGSIDYYNNDYYN